MQGMVGRCVKQQQSESKGTSECLKLPRSCNTPIEIVIGAQLRKRNHSHKPKHIYVPDGWWYRPIVPYSDVAEGIALLLGMEFVKDMLFRDVEINSDYANVFAAFNNNNNMQHNYLGTIDLECSIT
ncbi:hypothetical protein A2U01_0016148 [Trifolium medium]|uniref:RNase H type-1 domain-containing protein n=1 Tax=Trifolium medium TaxID=97028 RepID=A0A392N9N1_9FABA|nr:hypothetical protein [Trifolium medium]